MIGPLSKNGYTFFFLKLIGLFIILICQLGGLFASLVIGLQQSTFCLDFIVQFCLPGLFGRVFPDQLHVCLVAFLALYISWVKTNGKRTLQVIKFNLHTEILKNLTENRPKFDQYSMKNVQNPNLKMLSTENSIKIDRNCGKLLRQIRSGTVLNHTEIQYKIAESHFGNFRSFQTSFSRQAPGYACCFSGFAFSTG